MKKHSNIEVLFNPKMLKQSVDTVLKQPNILLIKKIIRDLEKE
jgi:hypothetical protein